MIVSANILLANASSVLSRRKSFISLLYLCNICDSRCASSALANLNISDTVEELTTYCVCFLNALRCRGGPLERFADKIKSKWITAGRELVLMLILIYSLYLPL